MADPFISLRGAPLPKRVDFLDEQELETLKSTIKQTYIDHIDDTLAGEASSTVITLMIPHWVDTLEAALGQNPQFQRLIIDEEITPGSHNFKLLMLDELWCLGLHLDNLYDLFTSFNEAWRFIEQNVWPKALQRAQQTIVSLTRKHGARSLQAIPFDARTGQAPLALTSTDEHVATMFVLAQEEQKQNNLRLQVYRDINDLKSFLPSLEGGQELLSMYQTKARTPNQTLIDKFTGPALVLLSKFNDIPALKPLDMEPVMQKLDQTRDITSFAGEDVDEYAEEEDLDADEDQALDDDDFGAVEGADEETDDFDLPLETSTVENEARVYYDDRPVFFYPAWRAPSRGALYFRTAKSGEFLEASQSTASASASAASRSNSSNVDAEPRPTSILGKLKRAKGFVSARQWSDREERELEKSITNQNDILRGAVAYLKKTTGLDKVTFYKKGFKDCLDWLSQTTERTQRAVDAPNRSIILLQFSGFQMQDNWIHVRYLLEALRIELSRETIETTGGADEKATEASEQLCETLRRMESWMMIIFAIMRAAADDPLPWYLVLDGLLAAAWRTVLDKPAPPTAYQSKLYTELVTWCHGTAINAFIIRAPRSTQRGNEIVEGPWYKMLFDYDPTCANTDCLRLRPHPDTVSAKSFRAVASVGTREARVGLRGIRAFISVNRNHVYMCLYQVLRMCKPSKELVILFFWYSHLYHSATCKATRGKHAINAF